MSFGERNHRRIGNQHRAFLVRDCRQRFKVGHFELRIGDNLKKDAAGFLVNIGLNFSQIGQIAQSRLNAKSRKRASNKRQRIAEQVQRRHYVAALTSHRH